MFERGNDANLERKRIIALVGNPNVGKSSIFNRLTGYHQHTGNWSGKTVEIASGAFTYKGRDYLLVDLPGTYSLVPRSEEERVAGEYIMSSQASCTVIVLDATSLERNIRFALQILNITGKVIVCLNLMDEADKCGIVIDKRKLEQLLGVPVIMTSASTGEGLDALKETIRSACDGFVRHRAAEVHDENSGTDHIEREAERIYRECVINENKYRKHWFDTIALGRYSGKLLLLMILFMVFWLTIYGANYLSMALETIFDIAGGLIAASLAKSPWWIRGIIYDGIYSTTAKVISVMLPPMLIFFPLFSYLEDLGFLPRAAFIMDHSFERCGSCGKQVLTMSMGLGCNAVGVMGSRIISSRRERLLAILTNSLIPCNGRFPTLIILINLFFSQNPLLAACILTAAVLLTVAMTFFATKVASLCFFKKEAPDFFMEIPSYRRPRLRNIFSSSLINKVLKTIRRAVAVAAPAGILIWCLQSFEINGISITRHLVRVLEPVGSFLGMDGVILLAFILSFPANELLIPLIILILTNGGVSDLGTAQLLGLLASSGWSQLTAICTMIFTLFHWPCSTTLLTIRKETGSWKWTTVALLLPVIIGTALCVLLRVFYTLLFL